MQTLIPAIGGVILASGFLLLVRRSGIYPRQKRSFAVGLIVVALLYVGFGFFADSLEWKITELIGVPVYALFAWLGLRKSGWFLALGWALHVIWDVGLHGVATPFVPPWYIAACLGFDLLVAGYIGFQEIKKQN